MHISFRGWRRRSSANGDPACDLIQHPGQLDHCVPKTEAQTQQDGRLRYPDSSTFFTDEVEE